MRLDEIVRIVNSREVSAEELLVEIRAASGCRSWNSLFKVLSPILGVDGSTLHRFVTKNPKTRCNASRRTRHAMILVLAMLTDAVPDTIVVGARPIRRR